MEVAIITTGKLPVPAVKGGAVEVLTDYLIKGFEKEKNCNLDIYTIKDKELGKIKVNKKTNIIQIHYHKLSYFICRCINYLFKMLKKDIVIFPYDLKIANKMKNKQYDYIIIENNLYVYRNVYSKYKKENSKTKFIFHMHNTLSDNRSKKAYQFIAKTADKIIFVSKFLRDECFKICKSNNAEVLYNCINFDIFNLERDLSLDFKLHNNDFNFIYTGRITEEKGILELVQAFKKLNKEFANTNLIIVGSKIFGNNKKDDFSKKISSEVNNSNIHITGYVKPNDIPKYLNIADVVVIPSIWEEPFGVVALEAMAMKKAIIATNSGGLTEPLNKECAIIVEKNNLVNNLYQAMKKLYLDTKLCKKIGNNGYSHVCNQSEFNLKNYYDNFVKIINKKSGE